LRISIYVRVYCGIRYVMQLKLSVRPEGLQVTEGSAGSLLLGTILKRASYKTRLYAFRPIPYTSNGTPWTVVLGVDETYYKHCSLIPPLVSNNNLALLRCGYMCARTLVHISKHLGRMSNNNKRCQPIVHYMLCQVCFHLVLPRIFSFMIITLL